LSNLHTLDIAHNQLEVLPEALGSLDGLRFFLYLSSNRPQPPAAKAWRAGKPWPTSNVTDNRLVDLPEAIGELAGLQELRLYNNQITALPGAFGELRTCGKSTSKQPAARLPDSFGRLANLKSWTWRTNRLEALPPFDRRPGSTDRPGPAQQPAVCPAGVRRGPAEPALPGPAQQPPGRPARRAGFPAEAGEIGSALEQAGGLPGLAGKARRIRMQCLSLIFLPLKKNEAQGGLSDPSVPTNSVNAHVFRFSAIFTPSQPPYKGRFFLSGKRDRTGRIAVISPHPGPLPAADVCFDRASWGWEGRGWGKVVFLSKLRSKSGARQKTYP